MKTRLARSETKNRKLPRRSPAIHFLRPMFLTIAGLLWYGAGNDNACALTAAAALAFLSVLPALVLHSSYRSRQERIKEISCG